MATLTTSYSLTVQQKGNLDERSTWQVLRFLSPSLADISIDYDEGEIKTYRAVELTADIGTGDHTCRFQVRFDSGDVVQDFNNAARLLAEEEADVNYLPSVLSYVLASVGTCATMGRGVTIFRDIGLGLVLRAALPNEYLTPGKPLSEGRIN